MYNVVISFGNYPTTVKPRNQPGPYTSEELGLMWIKHVGQFSAPGMLSKYRLILLLPRDIVIPEVYNLDMDLWGEKKRFDENNKTQQWPLGPNMVFQQVLWLYHYGKLAGPFLWCEPDCVPTKPTWLDDLFTEYEQSHKPFMGAFVEALTVDGVRTGKHMSGNAIYPDKPYLLAPTLMEARILPWDCYSANQIINQCHFTTLIQHDRGIEVPRVNPETVLYHPDKAGFLIKGFNGDVPSLMGQTGLAEPQSIFDKPIVNGKSLVEVFTAQEPRERPFQRPPYPRLDEMLDLIRHACSEDYSVKRKVAYYMIENQIVNNGFWAQAKRRMNQAKKKEEAAHAEPAA